MTRAKMLRKRGMSDEGSSNLPLGNGGDAIPLGTLHLHAPREVRMPVVGKPFTADHKSGICQSDFMQSSPPPRVDPRRKQDMRSAAQRREEHAATSASGELHRLSR